MQLFYQSAISEGKNYLDTEESRHCVKVLRKQVGDTIHLTDGKGAFYTARIDKADQRQCSFEIIKKTVESEKKYHIHIAIAPTKNLDRMEWFVEKAVELGVDEISFVRCQNSERKGIKSERLQRKAIAAMKQSLKAILPDLHAEVSFQEFIENVEADEKFIAYVDNVNTTPHLKSLIHPDKSYCILIGPEGDFSSEEITLAQQQGFQAVSLGKSRLRTETAGIAACLILNLTNE